MGIIAKRKKEPKSLKRSLMVFIILCWVVPVVIFFTFTTASYREGIVNKSEAVMEDQLANVASFAAIRIDEAITLCQRPSYERTWENAWWYFVNESKGAISKKDKNNNEKTYLKTINSSLKSKLYSDERFNLYAYYQIGKEKPDCYSSRIGISDKYYMEEINESILEFIRGGSNYTGVRVIDGRVFIVRNLYTTMGMSYTPFGTLVVELNKNWVFKDSSMEMKNKLVVCIDNTSSILSFSNTEEEIEIELTSRLLNLYDISKNHCIDIVKECSYQGYLYQKKFDNYHMGVAMLANQREIYASLYDLYRMVLFMGIVFVPMVIYCIYFLRRQIQMPVKNLVCAAKEMEQGNIGVVVEENTMPNEEFNYLVSAFNSMSLRVKYLFDTVYNEKLARKDAQIAALQAQINPHFLNNTLEMMNWQARMNQDTVISKMIEALGTVLDYRMNRANVREIHLWEEIRCADAYLYIMSMRYGQRLQIEKEVDEDLKLIKVPPLILQPLLENAIVHGVERVKVGTIKMHIYHDEEKVYVKVQNSGRKMTEKDLERIQLILNGDEQSIPKDQKRHTSIGIRNVNLRIKLVYGEEYGLYVSQDGEGITVSMIVLPFCKEEGQD